MRRWTAFTSPQGLGTYVCFDTRTVQGETPMIEQTHARRRKAARRAATRTFALETLESRRLMAVLGLQSAQIKPDGRIVELTFSAPADRTAESPDWYTALHDGQFLTTSSGIDLEPIGSIVTNTNNTLTWTVDFLVTNPAQTITYNAAPLTISAPQGLLKDNPGNLTAAINKAAIVNNSLVDSDGFTSDQFQRGSGGFTLYVSSTHGSDTRSLSPGPKPRHSLRHPTGRHQSPPRRRPQQQG